MNHRLYALLWIGLLLTAFLDAFPQCVVYKDSNQQLVTTCEFYNASGKSATAAYRRETYLGSPFLTYPVWQEGQVQVKKNDKVLNCELAYNVVSSDVMCRFNGDSTVVVMTPDKFVINGTEYIRQPNKLYATVLYSGPTKLLMSQSRQIEANHNYSFTKNKEVIGIYHTTTKYYLRKEDNKLVAISLSKKAILIHLMDQREKIEDKFPASLVTSTELIEILKYYDSLEINKPSTLEGRQ